MAPVYTRVTHMAQTKLSRAWCGTQYLWIFVVKPVLQLTLLRSIQDSPPGRQVLGQVSRRLSCGGKEGPGGDFLAMPHGAGLLGRGSPRGAHSLPEPLQAAWLAIGRREPTPLHRLGPSILPVCISAASLSCVFRLLSPFLFLSFLMLPHILCSPSFPR